MFEPWLIAPIASIISILAGLYFYYYVEKQDSGTPLMKEITEAIKEGSRAFLKKEYTILAIFVVVVGTLIGIVLPEPIWTTTTPIENISLSLAYFFGAAFSALAGYVGMDIATKANAKAAFAAKKGLNKAFPIGFRGGAVMGLAVVGFSLLGISIVYVLTGDARVVLGFSFGASALALFAKAGGGIFTKTADISADLVGKVELGIPEDDPRNPAVIADNVGDNVGDVAGMGADLADSYIASIVAVMLLGTAIGETIGVGIDLIQIPLVFSGLGIFASIIGAFTLRIGENGNPGKALNLGTYVTTIIFGIFTFIASYFLEIPLELWGAGIVGLSAGIIIGTTSDYFTSEGKTPLLKTAEASKTGTATNIIVGFSYGLQSVFPPLLGIGVASVVAYYLCEPLGIGYGVYGIGMAAIGMLSIVGLIISNDAYGPIVDNSRGIAEQAGLGDEVIRITDELDAAGNTAKAITKGFAIGAAGLTVIALLATFQAEVVQALEELIANGLFTLAAGETVETLTALSLLEPKVLLGVFIGIAMPALFSAMVMLGVGRNAERMIKEVRRQFKEIPGLKEGKEGVKPDYARCVDIATTGALKELLPASTVTIGVTLAVGFIGGFQALGGFLAGAIFSGLLLALLMSNAGGLWDNAKKYIETGVYGGKGSDAHKAAVVGDTVGDPFKDTAGPSLNTMITVMSLVASLFAALIVQYNLFGLLGL
jgi:K(+)-stimulated pyrophosphate-energized sodium pump